MTSHGIVKKKIMALYRRPAAGIEQKARIALICCLTWPVAWFRLRDSNRRLLLVHLPGKVASKSIVAALRSSEVAKNCRIFHTHILSPDSRTRLRQIETPWTPSVAWGYSEFLSRRLSREKARDRPLIITVVRNPFDMHPSSFIHNLERFLDEFSPFEDDPYEIDFEVLRIAYLERFPHSRMLQWYDSEIQSLFGVDIIRDDPSYVSEGYMFFASEFADVAMLRYEQLSIGFCNMTRHVFGIRLELPVVNTTASRGLTGLLTRLRDRNIYPPELKEMIESSDLVQRFYPQRQ